MGACSSGGCGSGCGSESEIPLALDLTDRIAQSVPPQPLRVENQATREHLHRIFAKVEQRKIPFWTHLDLTYKCNTDCIHCYCQHLDPAFGGKYDKQDLTTAEVKGLLDQLADYGVLNLTLSGGELLVRRDFFDLAFYASREKHFALSLFTNGTLINDRIAQRLAELAPVSMEISLQGATAEVHDAIVQRPGSFTRVVRAVQLLRQHGIRVVLKSTLMQPNIHQADDIVRLAQRLGADAYRSTIEITPKNDGDAGIQRFQLTDNQMRAYIASDFPEPFHYQEPVAAALAKNKSTCGTGSIACYISPYGEVYPCIQLLISMGNIRERSFKEIWEAPSELRRKLDNIQTYGDLPDCKTCEYVQLCQRCHGLAFLETGDLTKCYKLTLRVARLKTEANEAEMARRQEAEPVGAGVSAAGMSVDRHLAGFTGFGH